MLRSIGGRSRSAGHRGRGHSIALGSIDLLEVGIRDQSGACTRSTTAKTADVLSKVVVVATLGTASPVTCTERNVSGTAATHATATHVVVTHVVSRRTHHARVAVAVAVHRVRGCSHGRERAAEASSAALKVREAARWAGPVTGTRAVLARREGGEDISGTVKYARGRRRDLDGLFVECTAVHAERFGSLQKTSVLVWSMRLECSVYLFVGGEDGEASTSGLMLVGGAEGPESDGSTTELSEPTLELGLGGVMRKSTHVKDLATLRQESTHVCAGIHGAGQDIGVLVGRLRLADQTAKDSCKGDGLLHGTTRRGGSQSLQVERQVVLDGSRGLDGLNLKGSTDVGQGTGAEG